MKNIFRHILIFILLTVFANTAFGDEIKLDTQKTISQLNSEIKAINTDVFEKLKQTNINLDYFLRDDLTKDDIDNLSYIINIYNKNTLSTEESKLIENKKNLYLNLTKYINPAKIEEYKAFITNDAEKIKQSIITKEIIATKTEIIQDKIQLAKEKIKENDEIIKEGIRKNIDSKLQSFKKNKEFIKLTKKQKQQVIDGIITKADNYINKFETIKNKTKNLVRKIEIYQILKNELAKFKNSL